MNKRIPYDFGSLSFSLGCLPLLFLAKLPSIPNHYFLLAMLLVITMVYLCIKKQFIRVLLWTDAILPFAGEEWQLKVKTKVTHSYLNEGGFDSQRFAIANRQLLTGKIEEAHQLKNSHNLRQSIVDKMLPYVNLFDYGDIMLALAFGERSRLTEQHKTVMFQIGIAHLMAISGMHIILVVYLSNRLIRGVQFFLPIRFIGLLC